MSSGSDASDYNQFRQGIYARGPFERRGTIPILGPEIDSFYVTSSVFGQSKTFADDTKYSDMAKYDAVTHINDTQGSQRNPSIVTNVNTRTPSQMDGVIEPLTIRTVVARTTTDSPYEMHSVKGHLLGGNEDRFLRTDVINQFYPVTTASIVSPYVDDGNILLNRTGTLYTSVTSTFSYTTTTASYTVPSGITSVEVLLWGAGGGTGLWPSYYGGGAGGFTRATLNVTPGQVFYVIVGGKGDNVTGSASGDGGSGGFGGGGFGTKGDASGGGGGGYSGIFTGSISQINAIAIAGGGGGGSGWAAGGGGGGLEGTAGASNGLTGLGGRGGTQSAGGECSTGGGSLDAPFRGSALQGGHPSGSQDVSSNEDGGGGGGGYWGGGGGGVDATAGGGGSGYVNGTWSSTSSQEGGSRGILEDYSYPSGSTLLTYFGAASGSARGARYSSATPNVADPAGPGFVVFISTTTTPLYDYTNMIRVGDVYSNITPRIAPFDEMASDTFEMLGVSVTGAEIRGALQQMDPSSDSFIPQEHRSAGAGFTYTNNVVGTDSIAFGGLKK